MDTRQTLRPGVDNEHQEKADREPGLGVLHSELSERNDPEHFDERNARNADCRLNAEQEEVHVEMLA